MVTAALRAQIKAGDSTLTPPDTGSLRGDLISLFDLIMEHAGGISMVDYFQKFAHENYLTLIIKGFFAHAQARGERNDCRFLITYTTSHPCWYWTFYLAPNPSHELIFINSSTPP